jgi:type IV pilus assembly protein PilV
MMEVLVAMLVIGTGALALVMLQLHALRSSAESAQHARATLLAQELAELRAATPIPPGASDPYLFSFSAGKAMPARADCDLAPCSPSGFANAVIADWAARLTRELPEARATVCRDARKRRKITGPARRPQRHRWCSSWAGAVARWRPLPHRHAFPLLTLVLGR